jgi:organic hydroperoxide reductase OsmC/OhrA
MLSYLYVCALEGVVVTNYIDEATGVMIENEDGGGNFREVTLNPKVRVADESMIDKANELHHRAHEVCYIANSVNFEVKCFPTCQIEQF